MHSHPEHLMCTLCALPVTSKRVHAVHVCTVCVHLVCVHVVCAHCVYTVCAHVCILCACTHCVCSLCCAHTCVCTRVCACWVWVHTVVGPLRARVGSVGGLGKGFKVQRCVRVCLVPQLSSHRPRERE